ncbi:MAG: 3-deoxy-manno-octulosonate cytidylyltransferase [Deltaproteobacteria bacterium]|nr:MAG: 3-deoxy-manno-octulosonate cytidylyltransferase [Deltaproteobacteria bacterium]
MPLRVVLIIPARYASERLPGKPLIEIRGKPLIQYTYERARASSVDDVIVATDDPRILDRVEGFGGRAVLTSPAHPSGTDRVAEVATRIDADVIVNLQGDEPLIDPAYIDKAIAPFSQTEGIQVTTLVAPLREEELDDPNVVKVVLDHESYALYFSRAPIPFSRDDPGKVREGVHWKHIGLYAYRRDFLLMITRLPPSPLEEEEKLEQLRVLENGYRIKAVPVPGHPGGVDTWEDLRRIEPLLP